MMDAAAPFADVTGAQRRRDLRPGSRPRPGSTTSASGSFRGPIGRCCSTGFRDECRALRRWAASSVHTLFAQLARNRLLIADLLTPAPEIHDIEIAAPIIIAGLPRTGTTHLHNLLAADPALRSLPVLGEPRAGAAARRCGRTRRATDPRSGATARRRRLHQRGAAATSGGCTR